MKRTAIFLLTFLIFAAAGSFCVLIETANSESLAGQASPETGGLQNNHDSADSGVGIGQAGESGQISTEGRYEGRQPGMQRLNSGNITGSGRETGQFRDSGQLRNNGQAQNSRIPSLSPGRNGNSFRNAPSVPDNEGNGQADPSFQRKMPAGREFVDREDFRNFLEEWTSDEAAFRQYVTPDAEAVESYLEENGLEDKYEIYEAALAWVWVSDETLHGTEEKWLTPTEFLEETPDYETNPVSGQIASDCEDQANALASLLIASGEYDESTVRVTVGEVNFGSGTGGHAWVEVYESGEWLPLDPTGGPYYDDGSSEFVEVDVSGEDYDYYGSAVYPALEVWYYYNNLYFTEGGEESGDVPDFWAESPESYPKSSAENLKKNWMNPQF